MKRDCLTREDIRVLLEGELSPARLDALSDHLERCGGCRRSVESSAGNVGSWRPFWIEAAAPSPGPSPVLRGLMDRLVQASDWPQLDSPEQIVAGMRHLLEPSDLPGSLGRFGGFEIHGVMDAGGMGVVWRAWDSTLNRMVALKVLSPVLATSGAARHRFLREARAAAAIRHENVVPTFSAAEIHGLPCMAMELVPGESLARRLERQGRLASADVVRIGLQVADGLAAAHAQAIVHRDVKPANLLIEHGTGRVRIWKDLLAGDVALHTSGTGVAITWTSPGTGLIDLSGAAWDAYFERGRDASWALSVNGTTVAEHSSVFDLLRTDAAASFGNNVLPGKSLSGIPVSSGDAVTFSTDSGTENPGHFLGVDITVDFTAVPEPISSGIAVLGLVGLPVTRRLADRKSVSGSPGRWTGVSSWKQ